MGKRLRTFDFVISDSVFLRYQFEVVDCLTADDDILITLTTSTGSYILEKENYFYAKHDVLDMIYNYQSNTLLEISEHNETALIKGVGYYLNLKSSEIEINNPETELILEDIAKKPFCLFARISVSDTLTCCYKNKGSFFLELSSLNNLDIPDGKNEETIFLNWLNNDYQILERIEISDHKLEELVVFLETKII